MKQVASLALMETAIAAALWGTSFPVINVGINAGLDPRTFAFLRFALAAPVMLGVAAATGRSLVKLLTSRAIWVIGAFNAVGFLCQFVGQQYTSASTAALLVNMSLVFAGVGSAAFLGERIGRLKAAGIALAFLGAVLITTDGDLAGIGRGGEALGYSLYLLAAASWAGYIVYSKKKEDEEGWDALAAAACIVAVTTLFLLPPALTAGMPHSLSEVSLSAIVYTAVFNTVIPFALYQQGLKYLSASSSAVMLIIEILVGVLVSAVFLGQVLGGVALVGAAAVLCSIVLVSGVEIRGKSLSVRVTDASRVKDA